MIGMSHQIATLRQRLHDQEGMTLVELVVAMSILSIAMVILLSTLTSIQKASVNEDVRSRTINQVRLAMQTIDRQVRSGNLLYPPNAAGYSLLIYTQAYAAQDQAAFGGTSRCAYWTINSQNQLMYGFWQPLTPSPFTTTWQVVSDGIMNRVQSQSAFTLDPTGRTMTVLFLVNSDPTGSPNATQRLQTSVTGRNTSFGYPLAVCAILPTNVPT
jgi:prepilin-type N-terminal cleavage/methylation domain-containing protein